MYKDDKEKCMLFLKEIVARNIRIGTILRNRKYGQYYIILGLYANWGNQIFLASLEFTELPTDNTLIDDLDTSIATKRLNVVKDFNTYYEIIGQVTYKVLLNMYLNDRNKYEKRYINFEHYANIVVRLGKGTLFGYKNGLWYLVISEQPFLVLRFKTTKKELSEREITNSILNNKECLDLYELEPNILDEEILNADNVKMLDTKTVDKIILKLKILGYIR